MVTASSRSRDAVVVQEQLLGELESRIEGPARQLAAGTRSIWEVSELDLDVAFSATHLVSDAHLICRCSTRLRRTREQAHGLSMEELSRSAWARSGWATSLGALTLPLRCSTTPYRRFVGQRAHTARVTFPHARAARVARPRRLSRATDRAVNCASAGRGAARPRRGGASSSRSQSPDRAARRGTQSLSRPARPSSS